LYYRNGKAKILEPERQSIKSRTTCAEISYRNSPSIASLTLYHPHDGIIVRNKQAYRVSQKNLLRFFGEKFSKSFFSKITYKGGGGGIFMIF
jgi:hypothetical protein